MESNRYRELFLAESREHISEVNHHLLALESDPTAARSVEAVFRAVHTIKGMAATMGYTSVAELSHQIENLLDRVRLSGEPADPDLLELCFAGVDGLERSIELAVADRHAEFDVDTLIGRLSRATEHMATGTGVPEPGRGPPTEAERAGLPLPRNGGPAAHGAKPHAVQVVISRTAMLPGARALLVLRRARELGEVRSVDPEEALIGQQSFAGELRFVLCTARAPDEVQEVLSAVGELERVAVDPKDSGVEESETGTATLPLQGAQAPDAADGPGIRAPRHVRVELDRLDALMDQLGELVILRDRLQQVAARSAAPELNEAIEQGVRLINGLQDQVMRVRMVPTWQVFDRFPRLVRDAARDLGKRVEFMMEGGDIEFDRSMLDELVDALVHLLRNAVDHGIETPEERLSKGKSGIGTLRLSASRERDHAVIRVEDDGRGIDRNRLRSAAVATGTITAEAAEALDDDEVLGLITRSGLSTADQVTDVSGRGVGLDVVATRIRALGGALGIESEEGTGSCFTLRLPLTLAVVRALLVRVREEVYALPLLHVSETAEFHRGEMCVLGGQAAVRLRGDLLPIVDLRAVLQYDRAQHSVDPAPVVVLEFGDQVVGLVVDALLGQQEIVVKRFDSAAHTLRVFSGATILSDGRPALILDAASLFIQSVTLPASEAA